MQLQRLKRRKDVRLPLVRNHVLPFVRGEAKGRANGKVDHTFEKGPDIIRGHGGQAPPGRVDEGAPDVHRTVVKGSTDSPHQLQDLLGVRLRANVAALHPEEQVGTPLKRQINVLLSHVAHPAVPTVDPWVKAPEDVLIRRKQGVVRVRFI